MTLHPTPSPSPTISVIIPTYKRLDLLRRAIQSVQSQTFPDWELIVSDDQDPPGETWIYLQQLASSDPRIRITRNPGPHGQCGNVSHAMRLSRGTWIKFLYDDDLLKSHCLAVFAAAVAGQDSVIFASCNVAEYRDGKLLRSGEQSGPFLLLIPQRYLHLGMYLQEHVGGGVPTQILVRRSVIERGVLFDPHPELRSGVDSYFSARVAQLGDSLLIRLPLVEFHQGAHESISGTMNQQNLDAEYRLLRRIQRPMIDPSLHPPSLGTIYQMLNLIRAVNRASRRQFAPAISLAVRSWRPGAWLLAAQWLLRRRYPDRFSRIPKTILDDASVRDAMKPVSTQHASA